MANDNPRPTKAERQAAARAKAKQLRQEQERRERQAKITRRALLGGGIAVVAAAGVGAFVATRKDDQASAVATAKANKTGIPKVVLTDGSWTYGKTLEAGSTNSGAKVIDVYFDYSCHFCAAFEVLHSPEIEKLLKAGKITLALHPCKILGQDWTDMVMNAQGVILDQAPDKALDFHNRIFALFAQIYQAQDASMLTSENVVKTAQEAGVPDSLSSQITKAISANTYSAWTQAGTDHFTSEGFQGTPTVLVGGEQVDLSKINTADGLTKLLGA